jgi:hypothetical protein
MEKDESPAGNRAPEGQPTSGQPTAGSRRLSDRHRADLHASAITDAVLDAVCARSWPRGWRFRWVDHIDELELSVYDRDKRPEDGRKVEWPKGQTTFLNYIRQVEDSDLALIVEGIRQSLAAASWAPEGWSVYGMNGCDGIHKGIADRLDEFKGKAVVVWLDADWKTKSEVRGAAERIARLLISAGADSVRFVTMPADLIVEDTDGADDVLARTPESERTALMVALVEAAGSVSELVLPEDFYASRESLARIRRQAHGRGSAADPVLYAVLARLSGMVPTDCRADTGIGRSIGASLNLFAAAVGPSGTGKSSSAGVARDLFRPPDGLDFADSLPIGSGEGLAEVFMGTEMRETGEVYKNGDRKGESRLEKVRAQVRHNAFLVADEGEAFTKMQERSGATIGPATRSAWYGATLGNQNADAERKRIIPEGSYSLGMLIGFQPETVQPMLNDAATGTPQRFVYCWTTDPSIPATPDPFYSGPRFAVFNARSGLVGMAPAVVEEVRRQHHARSTGALTVPRLDAHGYLTRVKLAGLLALLDGRHSVTEEDWRLSGVMWETSCRVRDELLRYGQTIAARAQEASNRRHAEREGLAEVARSQAVPKVLRIARLVAKYVHDTAKPARTVGEVNRRLESPNRRLLTEALEHAVSVGWVVVDGSQVEPGPSRPSEEGFS